MAFGIPLSAIYDQYSVLLWTEPESIWGNLMQYDQRWCSLHTHQYFEGGERESLPRRPPYRHSYFAAKISCVGLGHICELKSNVRPCEVANPSNAFPKAAVHVFVELHVNDADLVVLVRHHHEQICIDPSVGSVPQAKCDGQAFSSFRLFQRVFPLEGCRLPHHSLPCTIFSGKFQAVAWNKYFSYNNIVRKMSML